MVPFVGAVLDTPCITLKTPLQTASRLISEKRNLSLYASFPCQTTQGRKKPLKRSRTKIRANAPHSQNEKHPIPLPTNSYVSPFHTTICFLHACTPARLHACTGTPVGATNTWSGTRYKKTYPSKKRSGTGNGGPTNQHGGASEPYRRIDREGAWHSATIRCHAIYRVWCWCFSVCLCCSSMRGGCLWISM
jgi:hypothetical protein